MDEPSSVFKSAHLPSLDALRFFAVLLVILDHGGLSFQRAAGDGVTYFFVLSGFLFSWIFNREWRRHGRLSFGKFYFRRALRILPASYVAILFTILAKRIAHLPVDYHHALAAAAYYANYYNAFHGHPPTGFDTFWSLSLEEQFYFVWPLLFVFFMRRGRASLIAFLATAITAVCAWRTLLVQGLGASHAYLYNAFDTRFDSLAIGCLLGLLVEAESFRPTLRRLAGWGTGPVFALAAIVGVGLLGDGFHYTVGFTVQSILIAVLILQLVLLHSHPAWAWLNQRWLAFLGTLSYSMYLFHLWGITIAFKLKFLPFAGILAAAVGFTIALAAFSYFGVERPFLRLREKFRAA